MPVTSMVNNWHMSGKRICIMLYEKKHVLWLLLEITGLLRLLTCLHSKQLEYITKGIQYSFKSMVQLMAKFIRMCVTHACLVIQVICQSLNVTCELVFSCCQSRVLHLSQTFHSALESELSTTRKLDFLCFAHE